MDYSAFDDVTIGTTNGNFLEGFRPTRIAGLLSSLWLTRFISSLLFGVGRTDAPTLAFAALLMATTALVA